MILETVQVDFVMNVFVDLKIDTSGLDYEIEEILNLRYELEDKIEEQELGEVVDGGIMMDGSEIDIGFISSTEEEARLGIEEILEANELLSSSTIEIRPYENDEELEEDFQDLMEED